jgi:hypothetical protein
VASSFLLGWFLHYLLLAAAGFPYDCDARDDCTALGEFVLDATWPVFIMCVLVAAGILLAARRAFAHRRGSGHDTHANR